MLAAVAVAPAQVVVVAAQLAVLELGGGRLLRRLRRHRGVPAAPAFVRDNVWVPVFQTTGGRSADPTGLGLAHVDSARKQVIVFWRKKKVIIFLSQSTVQISCESEQNRSDVRIISRGGTFVV